ncbi:hypothetical protein GQ457_06G008850 [Hibiscus cannabinus]
MEKCRIILAEQDNLLTFSELQERCHLGLQQDNLLTFSELAGPSRIISSPSQNLQDRCHLSLRRLIGLRLFFFPTSRMEMCRIILAEQDNLLTFSGLAGPVSSWPSSVDRIKTSIFSGLKDGTMPNYLSRAG